MNVQFAVSRDGTIHVLEVNPRASRTVPFVAKAIDIPIARIAARVMAGEALAGFGLEERPLSHVAVKESVFPFARFPGVDVILGPEMKSTGEVMGLDQDFGRAFAKAQLAAGGVLRRADAHSSPCGTATSRMPSSLAAASPRSASRSSQRAEPRGPCARRGSRRRPSTSCSKGRRTSSMR